MAVFESAQRTDQTGFPPQLTSLVDARRTYVSSYVIVGTEVDTDTINLFTLLAGYIITNFTFRHDDLTTSGTTPTADIGETGGVVDFLVNGEDISVANQLFSGEDTQTGVGQAAPAADQLISLLIIGTSVITTAATTFEFVADTVALVTS